MHGIAPVAGRVTSTAPWSRRVASWRRTSSSLSAARDDGSGAVHHLITLFDTWIRDINEAVSTFGGSDGKYREMGTTVAILYHQADFVIVGHVGDSRAYLLREGRLRQLTSDHSWVNEQSNSAWRIL